MAYKEDSSSQQVETVYYATANKGFKTEQKGNFFDRDAEGE